MSQIRIAVIGLGYVGLPLAVEFAKKYPVTGFDIKQERVDALRKGHDETLEISDDELKSVLCADELPASAPQPGAFFLPQTSRPFSLQTIIS